MFWPRMNAVRRGATVGNPLELFNRVMGASFAGHDVRAHSASPAFNLWADEGGAVLTSELPGIAIEDVDITVSGKQVSVAGTRKEDLPGEARRVRNERAHGAFRRAFELPFAVDATRVEARLSNGVLEIVLPRAESDKPRKIEIRAG